MPKPQQTSTIREKLIVALDFETRQAAQELVEALGETIIFYKIGLELFMTGEYFKLIDFLQKKNKKIFTDLKLHDIPQTVYKSVKNLCKWAPDYLSIHADPLIIEAALRAREEHFEAKGMQILAVTVLTNMNTADLHNSGIHTSIEELVLKRAHIAASQKCHGVICAGKEAAQIKTKFPELLVITPGIRLSHNPQRDDDQKRISTIHDAIASGADHIILGRALRQSQDPKATAAAIQRQIADLLTKK